MQIKLVIIPSRTYLCSVSIEFDLKHNTLQKNDYFHLHLMLHVVTIRKLLVLSPKLIILATGTCLNRTFRGFNPCKTDMYSYFDI